jgi:hypothetical protein
MATHESGLLLFHEFRPAVYGAESSQRPDGQGEYSGCDSTWRPKKCFRQIPTDARLSFFTLASMPFNQWVS